jgi:hypothetical protein
MIQNQKDKLTHEYIILHQTRRMNIKLSASCWCGMCQISEGM